MDSHCWKSFWFVCESKWLGREPKLSTTGALTARTSTTGILNLTLKEEEQNTYQLLVRSLEEKLEPQKQRQVRKLVFSNQLRRKEESLVDLATGLRHLATTAYQVKDTTFIEGELVDQFIPKIYV